MTLYKRREQSICQLHASDRDGRFVDILILSFNRYGAIVVGINTISRVSFSTFMWFGQHSCWTIQLRVSTETPRLCAEEEAISHLSSYVYLWNIQIDESYYQAHGLMVTAQMDEDQAKSIFALARKFNQVLLHCLGRLHASSRLRQKPWPRANLGNNGSRV